MTSSPIWVGSDGDSARAPEASTASPPRRGELVRLLAGELPQEFVREVRRSLADPLFRRREGLTAAEAGSLAYARAQVLVRDLRFGAAEIARDPRRLYALHEWVGLADGVTCTILGIHYSLALGSIAAQGEGRAELQGFISELERSDSFGVFLATEIGFGNNVASLETEAVYDPGERAFVLSSPTPRSAKFMPNTACPVPKLAVVLARLVSGGRNHGVFPFLVRIRGADGALCPGVNVSALTEKPGYPLDNAVTRFDRVRVPKAHLLAGPGSTLHDDGRFESRTPSRLRRFLNAMDRVQTGRVCFTSTVVSYLRAATWIAMRYTAQRSTFAPSKRSVPLLSYRNVQRDVFGALASAYALTFAVRHVQERFRGRTPDSEEETFRLVASVKAVATSECAAALVRLRERCGAAGLFSANRILEFWTQVQGLITAEGDNQLMLLKVGAKLGSLPAPPATGRPIWASPAPLRPRLGLELLRFRERCLQEELATDAQTRRGTNPFVAWNDNVNRVMAAAEAHGDRIVAGCFVAAVEDARDDDTRKALETLCALWVLGRIERHAGWFLAEGCLTGRTVKELGRIRDRLCAETEHHAAALADAFDLDNTLLQAPIAETDYVRAYSTLPRCPT